MLYWPSNGLFGPSRGRNQDAGFSRSALGAAVAPRAPGKAGRRESRLCRSRFCGVSRTKKQFCLPLNFSADCG